MTLRALIVDAELSLDECASLPPMLGRMAVWRWACGCVGDGAAPVVVKVVVVVAREALAGVSPVGVFPFRPLIVRLSGSCSACSSPW